MKILPRMHPTDQDLPEASSETYEIDVQPAASESEHKADTPAYLLTLDVGIGDAVAVGLSAVDQIIQNDPDAYGKIDILCNPIQAEIFSCDPRINRVFPTDIVFFPGNHITQWLRGIILDTKAARLINFLQERHYKAVCPTIVAPGLFYRLHAPIMYPDILEMLKDLLAVRRHVYVPERYVVRKMVNHAFGKETTPLDEEAILYLCAEHVKRASRVVSTIKKHAHVAGSACTLAVVAADSASAATRIPTALLASALSDALRRCPELIACILPSYTTNASEELRNALMPEFTGRIFLLFAEPGPTLLETAALIDQADICIAGDTGIMHLAATTRRLKEGEAQGVSVRNSIRIISIFGATSPDFYGYRKRAVIIGEGRKEQMTLKPGIFKEAYDPKGRNLFDHIAPRQIADTIVRLLSTK